MEKVIGKIILIKPRFNTNAKINSQMQHDTAAAAGIQPGFRKLVVNPNSLRTLNETVYLVRTFQDGQYVAKAHTDMEVYIGDILVTGEGMLCAVELLLGGRVGVNPGSAIVIETERSIRDLGGEQHVAFRKGGVWAASSNLKEPIEIQTNGGILGIKDFVQIK